MRKGNRLGMAILAGSVLLSGASQVLALRTGQGPELTLFQGARTTVALRGEVRSVTGEAREIVYEGSHKLSELIWDIKGIVMLGGVLSAQVNDYLSFNAGYWMAVTEGNGGMVDYDWLDRGRPDRWSHFSESDVDVVSAYVFDINAAVRMIQKGGFGVYGLLGFKRDFWDWSDFGGMYIYSSSGTRRDIIGDFADENGIDYEQTISIPYLGVGVATVGHAWRVAAYLTYSPYTWAEDRDNHKMRDIIFEEEFEGGDYVGFGLEGSFRLMDRFFVTAAVEGQSLPEERGDTTIYTGGERYFIPDGAGYENTIVSATLGFGGVF